MKPYFQIDNLDLRFQVFNREKQALSIESLSIEKGEALGVVGESGAGKTVLAQTILRLLPSPPCIIGKDSHIFFDGVDLLMQSEKQMRQQYRGRRIAMIFQDPMSTLNPVLTVGRQIMDVLSVAGASGAGYKTTAHVSSGKAIRRKAVEMLERVKMPDAARLMDKYPHELSGGQRQRAIIAMALCCGAEFLIADEPTRNLDVTIQAGILKLIDDLRRELDITILYIANNMNLVGVTCDNVAVLKDGMIIESGPVRSVIRSARNEYTKLLLKTLPERETPLVHPGTVPIMQVKDLVKYYPLRTGFLGGLIHVKAVDGVSVDIFEGETLGIVGESGCGKTTFVNTILSLEKPTHGTVLFRGRDQNALSKKTLRAARRDVQVVFQDPFWSLDPRMLIRDVVGEPLKVHARLSAAQYAKKVGELLEMVGMESEAAYRFPHELSGGQRQRIAIARALALEAKFIVLDEPTSSIDVVSQKQILQLLDDLKAKYGLTYVLISHDLSVVHHMSTRIMVMYLGKVVEQGDAHLLLDNPLHPYTKALTGAIPRLSMNSLKELSVMEGGVPSAIDIPTGCRFHTRCPVAREDCAKIEPPLMDVGRRKLACTYGGPA